MDGLECSVVMHSSLERTMRIDAEFYNKESFEVLNLISRTNNNSLTTYVDISDGNHMSISDKFVDTGIPYYRGQDIKSFFIENSNPICIDENSFNQSYMKRSHLKKGDILLSIVGTIGSLALVYSNTKATCSCKLAILRPKKDVNAEVISIFLCSKYGQNQIKKFTRGAVQMGLILEDMEQLVVPAYGKEFCNTIQTLVVNAFDKEYISKQIYRQAEQLLLSSLGMDTFTSSTENVSVKTFSESFGSSGRIDAEYYQKKYDDLFYKINEKSEKLGDLVNIKKSIEPGSNEYQSEGIPFVRVSDITKYEISEPEIHLSRIPYENIGLQPKEDTILLSKDGSVGIAYKVPNDMEIITSGAILHLTVKSQKVLPDYLTLVLNSLIVQMQAERDAGGSIIQHWKPSEIEEVLVPILPLETQQAICDKIYESFELRNKSKKLLEKAKTAVEIAIEQGEEKVIDYLNESEINDI